MSRRVDAWAGRDRSWCLSRHASDRRPRVGVGLADARVATGDVAQRDESPVGGPVRRRARHSGKRLARSTAGSRGLAFVRTGSRRDTAHEILFRRPARHRVGPVVGPTRASTLGDRTAISRAQDRTRLRPFRRPFLSRMAASRGAHRCRVCVPSARTNAACQTVTDVSGDSSDRPGDLHRAVVCATTELLQTHPGTTENQPTDLTKSYYDHLLWR